MADDLYESLNSDDNNAPLYFDDEEETVADEAQASGGTQNRTFIIAVAVMGGLLVCAIGAFMIWMLMFNRQTPAQPEQISDANIESVDGTPVNGTLTPEGEATTSAEDVADSGDGEPAEGDGVEGPTETPEPTSTPKPTATPVVGPTKTPVGDESADATDGETSDTEDSPDTPTPTTHVRRTPTPTPRPTATPKPKATAAGGRTTSTAATGASSRPRP